MLPEFVNLSNINSSDMVMFPASIKSFKNNRNNIKINSNHKSIRNK